MNQRLTLPLFFLLHLGGMQGQDARYLNSNQSLLALNPAFAGNMMGVRNQASSRVIHSGGNGLLNIWSNNADFSFFRKKGGDNVSMDGIGLGHQQYAYWNGEKLTATTLTWARYIGITEGIVVVPAIQAGLGRWVSQVSIVNLATGEKTGPVERYADISGGIAIYAGKFIVGASGFHLNGPQVRSFQPYHLTRRYTGHASFNTRLSENELLQVAADHRRQGETAFTNLQLNFLRGRMICGVGYTLMRFGRYVEDWPYVTAGARLGWFKAQVTYNPVLMRGAGLWGHGLELHMTVSTGKRIIPQSFETL